MNANPKITRRDVLKVGAGAAGAAMLGWYIPGAAPSILTAEEAKARGDVNAIPEDVREVIMHFGAVVAITPAALFEDPTILKVAEDRVRGYLPVPPEVEGWIAEECLSDKVYHAKPGDHADPLALNDLVGVKQAWRMVRA